MAAWMGIQSRSMIVFRKRASAKLGKEHPKSYESHSSPDSECDPPTVIGETGDRHGKSGCGCGDGCRDRREDAGQTAGFGREVSFEERRQ